jgi:hypothetical protein
MSGRGKLSRRAFLRGASGVAIGLPFLNIMGCSSRAGEKVAIGGSGGAAGTVAKTPRAGLFPKRFVTMFSANGTVIENWRPAGGESDFTLSTILAPLEPHRQQILVLEGLDFQSGRNGPGDNHQKGMGHLLTGIELLEGTDFEGGNGELVGWGGGISVDQHIANAVGAANKFKSLEFGVQVFGASVWSRMSYAAADQPIPPEDDPYAAFDRIFADLGADPLGLERKRVLRHSVLDTVGDDYSRLTTRLGSEDKGKLDAHLAAIRDIEARLDSGGQLGGACQQPTLQGGLDLGENDNYPIIGKLQMDLLVMALACDLTSVASLQWNSSVSNRVFSWLADPIPDGHHDLSHFGDSDGTAMEKLTRINTWYAEQFAYLCSEMKKVQEGEGTLLDNTVMLWGNELGRGNSHSLNEIPFVLAGSAGGALRTGRYLKYDNTVPHNNLLVSICNAMDLPDTSFGNPAYCTGPLPNLT